VAKFYEATPPGSKVLVTNMVNFKPILDLFKNCKDDPVPSWRCTSKTWSFCSVCKNLRVQHSLEAEIKPSKKVDLGGYDFTTSSL